MTVVSLGHLQQETGGVNALCPMSWLPPPDEDKHFHISNAGPESGAASIVQKPCCISFSLSVDTQLQQAFSWPAGRLGQSLILSMLRVSFVLLNCVKAAAISVYS